MSKNHADRLARWKQREKELHMQRVKLDIDRIVFQIDFMMYGSKRSRCVQEEHALVRRRRA